MAGSARAVAVEWMNAVNRCDIATLRRLSDPAIVFTIGPLRHFEGYDGILDIVANVKRLSGVVDATVLDSIEQGNLVVLRRLERYTLPSGGVELPACSFVEVVGGRVTRWDDYKSMALLDELAG